GGRAQGVSRSAGGRVVPVVEGRGVAVPVVGVVAAVAGAVAEGRVREVALLDVVVVAVAAVEAVIVLVQVVILLDHAPSGAPGHGPYARGTGGTRAGRGAGGIQAGLGAGRAEAGLGGGGLGGRGLEAALRGGGRYARPGLH